MPDLLKSYTISFYPGATTHDLRLLLACTAVFAAVLNVYRHPRRIKRLLTIVALLGGAVALLALAQDLSGAEQIYWSIPTPLGRATAGPFVHYSHYSQFMNLCTGAAIGLLLVEAQTSHGPLSRFLSFERSAPFHPGEAHRPHHHRRFRDRSNDPHILRWWSWGLVAIVLLGVSSVFLSFSRGGVISLLAGAAFTAVALGIRRRLGFLSWLFGALIVASVFAIFYVGFDSVYERMMTLGRISVAEGGRWEILKDLTAVWKQFPAVGTGLGTHEMVYPMYDHSVGTFVSTHAENEYAQVLEESGISGLALLIGFAVLVWRGYVAAVRGVGQTAICAAVFGLGFGLLAVMVHSLSDFGQHLPANALLTSAFCALLLNLGRLGANGRTSSVEPPKPLQKDIDDGTQQTKAAATGSNPIRSVPPRAMTSSGVTGFAVRFGAAVATVAILAFPLLQALPDANRARLAERSWRTAALAAKSLRDQDWQGADERYADLISNASVAADLQPKNVTYQYWLNVYRWQSISRDRDPETRQARVAIEDLSFVQRIIAELHQARRLCPSFGPTLSVAGQLERFVLDNPVGAAHIRTGFALAPHDPDSCFAAARLDAQEGLWERAHSELVHVVALDPWRVDAAASVCLQAGRPEEAIALANGNETALLSVASLVAQSGTEKAAELATQARRDAFNILQSRCDRADADANSLASLAETRFGEGNFAAAAAYYRRAVDLQYDRSDWRYRLAQALGKIGQRDVAIHEAHICLRLRPEWAEAKQLIEQLSVEPGSAHLGT